MGILFISFLATAFLVIVVALLLFRKYRPAVQQVKDPLYWLTVIIVTPVVYVGFLLIWFSISSSFEAKAFNKQDWSESLDTRYIYTDDLIENNKLIGLSKTELTVMLGEADQTDDSTFVYYIGYSPNVFLNMDPDWLVTELTDEKVSYVYIRY